MSDRWSGRGGYAQGQGLRFESHRPRSTRFYAKKSATCTLFFFYFLTACGKVYFQMPTVKARVACCSVGTRNLGLVHVIHWNPNFFLPNSKTSLRILLAAKNTPRASREVASSPPPRAAAALLSIPPLFRGRTTTWADLASHWPLARRRPPSSSFEPLLPHTAGARRWRRLPSPGAALVQRLPISGCGAPTAAVSGHDARE